MNHSELAFKDQFETAERELASFVAAVKTLFGPEQAELSATDWLNAIEQVIHSNHPASPDWRRVTIIAATFIAQRLGSVPLTTEDLN